MRTLVTVTLGLLLLASGSARATSFHWNALTRSRIFVFETKVLRSASAQRTGVSLSRQRRNCRTCHIWLTTDATSFD
jgi:hypothetical protein